MIPIEKVQDIIAKHNNLEKELSSGNIDTKLFAKKSKEYSNLGNVILYAREFVKFESEKKEFDKIFESHGVTIFCDVKSWIYVRGCEIDFSTDLLNGGFKVNNPNATRTCGCGISFSA